MTAPMTPKQTSTVTPTPVLLKSLRLKAQAATPSKMKTMIDIRHAPMSPQEQA